MNRSMIDLWVGIFVVVGIGGLLFLALKVGNLASFSSNEMY
jgi:phospholipid/cholesterol/gamma-HCH transport system substrate-binding protein